MCKKKKKSIKKNNLHFCPLESDTKWTCDLVEVLQEVLCFIGVAAGVKQQPVFQWRSTDHIHSTHLSCPVSNHGVIFILGHRGGGQFLH